MAADSADERAALWAAEMADPLADPLAVAKADQWVALRAVA